MKKIRCTGCNGVASYESNRWPTLKLCYTCIQRTLTWLVIADLADANPFALELVEGVGRRGEWMGYEYFEFHGPSLYGGSNCFSSYQVNLERKFD